MESGRQTRRKGSLQSNSLQSTIDSKNKHLSLDKQTDLSSSMQFNEQSSERKSQDLNIKSKEGQIGIENASNGLDASDFSLQEQKQNNRLLNPNHDNLLKLTQENKERKSPLSDENGSLSAETKKQLEMLFEIAQSLASKGDYQQAIHIYNKIVKLNDKSTSAWIAIGHCYAVLGDNYKALSSYQQALSITSDSQRDDQLWYGIGLLYQKTGDWKNAETSFQNALKLNPKSSIKGDILYNLGIILKAQGDTKGAIRVLMNSITAGTFSVDKMVDVLCAVGLAQEELDESTEAMKIYKHAVALDENNLKALQCAGWLSFQLDRTNEALEYITKANLISEDDPNIWFMQARCFLKHKQYNKAYENLSNCIKKDQINSMYWNSLGILFGEMQQLKSAHECFSNALKFGISIAENYFNMGCLYELCSQFGDAIIMYDKAIELQPNFQLAYTRKLGAHFAQAENKQDALSDVKFKHHKFTLTFDKDQKPKNLLNISQTHQNRNGSIPESQTLNTHLLSNNEKDQNYLKRLLFNQGLSEPIFANALQLKGSPPYFNTHLIKGGSLGLNDDNNLESLYNIKENNHATQANDLIGNIKISNKSKLKGTKSTSKENILKDNIMAELQLLQNNLGEYDKLDKSELLTLDKTQAKNGFKISNTSKETEEDPKPRKKVKPDISNSPNNSSLEATMQEAGKKTSNIIVP